MASTDSKPVPQKNVAYRHYFDIRKNDGTLITSWTGADSEVSKDGAAFADCTNEATEIGTSGCGYIDLTSTEMNADHVYLKITVTNTSALPVTVPLYPEEAGDIRVNATQWNSLTTVALPLCPTTAGRTLDVTAGGNAGIDWANVEAPTTALALTGTTIATTQKVDVETIKTQAVTCAAGVTVNTNVGTTQPMNFTSTGSSARAKVDLWMLQGDGTAMDALTAIAQGYGSYGVIPADLQTIMNSALTQTSAGYLAASFSAMHDVASPVFTTASVNQTGNSYGIVNDGTNGNAAIKTQLGSMAGATFSTSTDSLEAIRDRGDAAWVTGGGGGLDAAGVRAAIGLASANLDTQLADIPTVSEFNARTLVAADYFDPAADTVANVTTVGTTTNLTNLPSIPANWLTAAGLASDAVTEIQSGLASQTSVDTLTAYVDTEVAAIKAKTDNLPASPAATGDIPSAATISTQVAADLQTAHGSGAWTTADVSGLATAANLATVAGYLDTEIAAILADTNELQTNQGNWLTATSVTVSDKTGFSLAPGTGLGNQTANITGTVSGNSTHDAAAVYTAFGNGANLTACATATGFATPTNVSDAQTAIIAQVDANETKIDALPTAASIVTALHNTAQTGNGASVGNYSLGHAIYILSNWSISGDNLLVKAADGTTIKTHALTRDAAQTPVSEIGAPS